MKTNPMTVCPFHLANWIWLDQEEATPNQYVCFRTQFSLTEAVRCAVAYLAVDSDFILSVNGTEVGRGQFSDYPTEKTYTAIPLDGVLHPGQNTLAVLAYYRGEDFSTYRAGQPGLICALDLDGAVVISDGSWRVRQSPAFVSGVVPKVTGQLAYTVVCDAREDDAWTSEEYDDGAWPQVRVLAGATDGYWTSLSPRPVPPVEILPELPVRLVAQGRFIRTQEDGSIAAIMAADALVTSPLEALLTEQPPVVYDYTHTPRHPADGLSLPDDQWVALASPADGETGTFLLVDVGSEQTGLLTLYLDAPAGTILDIAHGEHLDDGRVRMHVGGRNFADRYICAAGAQRYILPFRRLGGRYLQVHLSGFQSPVRVNYIGLRPTVLPVDDCGGFSTHDPLASRMYAVGKRTLQLCMHEHYEDCPWREQSLYAGDGRNQALYGYYAFGNYDFAAAAFDLLGRGIRDDGLLELCAPATVPVTIPCYSLQWITALADLWLFSGSDVLFRRFEGQIAAMLKRVGEGYDSDSGLYRVPVGKGIWNLYDWMDGLAGSRPSSASRWEAPYNLYLHEALTQYAWMLHQAGRHAQGDAIAAQCERLGAAIVDIFWNEREAAFATFAGNDEASHFAELTQVQALAQGLVPAASLPRTLAGLAEQRWYPVTLYTMLYKALALRTQGPSARALMAENVARAWEPMLYAGATSFWETARGAEDFDRAGSLCHGWSAFPVYYYQAWVLGVHPLEPGFTRFAIAPYPDRFHEVTGEIPTPAGPIAVHWTRAADGLHIDASGPETCRPELAAYPEAPVASASYNGQAIPCAGTVQLYQ